MSKKKGKEKGRQEEEKLNYAVQSGLGAIIKEHPRFGNFQEYLFKHLDQERIKNKFYELHEEALKKGMNEKIKGKYIYGELANYVASGSALDEKGKEVILKNGLEEKTGFLHKILHKHKFDGEKYLDNTMEAFQDLYALFKSGDYAQRMPELAESVTTLHDLNFLDPAIDILKAYGLIDQKRHKFLKENVYKKVGEETGKIVGGIEKYVVPQKIAASVIGFIGIMLVIFNSTITGSVIGNNSPATWGIVGGLMVLIALLLFFRPLKKKF